MSKKIEERYKVLDHIEHILLRPMTYLGSNKPNTSQKWIFNDGKMKKEEITFVPSFLKIFDEIITNSVDEHKRNKNLTEIEIIIKSDRIIIKDNGGIPVVIHGDHNKWVPEVIFGNLMSGSNYDDTESRIVAGTNGYGAKLTNVFSKEFIISTSDGKNKFSQTFRNNMRLREEPIVKKSKAKFTEISYVPDYEKFGLEGIDEDHFKMIHKRVVDIAGCNPQLKIKFNGDLINISSFEDYVKTYCDSPIMEKNETTGWTLGISSSSEGFQQISFANTTETYEGGTHVDYILNQILTQIREFIQKKHKVDIKPSDIKNHIFLFLNANIVNSSFSSQTKEKLITEVKDFGFTWTISDKTIKSILKSEVVSSILDWIDRKKIADENKLARELNKNLSKIKVDKLIDAKSKVRTNCQLFIFEGDSASSAFRKYRDPQTQGAFSLRGKFINAAEITTQKLIQNNEVVNLMGALGLKLGQKVNLSDLRYHKIYFFCDADYDGYSIVGLLINFLYKYWPELFEYGIVYKAETPIVVAKNLKKKTKINFYTQDEYNQWISTQSHKDWEIEYKKGLAALLDDEYSEIINNPKLTKVKSDDSSKKFLNIWFGKESELRKNEILN